MSQIILVSSYIGGSDYVFSVSVTAGKFLEITKATELGLVDDAAIRRHALSSYSYEWYEISPKNRITVKTGEAGKEREMIFEIPDEPLPKLPQKLDDALSIDLLECLIKYCKNVSPHVAE